MTTKIPCYIEFTDSGQYAKLVHKSGMIIAELLISDTNFMHRALHCYDRFGMMENLARPLVPYRGEVNELFNKEVIEEEIHELYGLLNEINSEDVPELTDKQEN